MSLKLTQTGSRIKGSYGPSGTEEANSCGAIALYNILTLCGKKVSYERIRDEIKEHWMSATVMGGMLGTNPLYVEGFLKKHLGVQFHMRPAEDRPYRDGIYLILYFYVWGAHFAAATFRNGKLEVFNETTGPKSIQELRSRTGAKMVLIGRVADLKGR